MTSDPSDSGTASQGLVVKADDPAQLDRAIEMALDYRGDVTIGRRSGGNPVSGYLFDRTPATSTREATVRVVPGDGGERVTIPLADIESVTFTGRDTAAGKSFETWMRNYVDSKLAGESANIFAEPLDD